MLCVGTDHAVQMSELHSERFLSRIGGRREADFLGPPFVWNGGKYTRFCLTPGKHEGTTDPHIMCSVATPVGNRSLMGILCGRGEIRFNWSAYDYFSR